MESRLFSIIFCNTWTSLYLLDNNCRLPCRKNHPDSRFLMVAPLSLLPLTQNPKEITFLVNEVDTWWWAIYMLHLWMFKIQNCKLNLFLFAFVIFSKMNFQVQRNSKDSKLYFWNRLFNSFQQLLFLFGFVESSNLECSIFGTLNDPEANLNRTWSELKLTKQTWS